MKKAYRKKLDAKAKAVRAKIQQKSGGDQFKNLKDWVKFFSENERLPSQKITCSVCKTKQTSMFGDNLKRTLPRFGSIEKLLTSFECSDCRKAKAPAKEVKVPKVRKSKEGDINVEVNTKEEYLTLDDMEDRKEKVRKTLPKMDPEARPIPIDLNDPEAVADLTRNACARPDIFLDSSCRECPLNQHCAANCKDMNRKPDASAKRKSVGPRRKL